MNAEWIGCVLCGRLIAGERHDDPCPLITQFELAEREDVTFLRSLVASLQDQIHRARPDVPRSSDSRAPRNAISAAKCSEKCVAVDAQPSLAKNKMRSLKKRYEKERFAGFITEELDLASWTLSVKR